MPFALDQLGKVNAAEVAGYAPETVLVVGPFAARYRATGWNRVRFGGEFHRIADANNQPPYQLTPMTKADLMWVHLEEAPYPEDVADTPHVVTG